MVVRTQGDDLAASLDQIGGQGVFVTEVEAAVADGRADAAVHSAKDMPSTMPAGWCSPPCRPAPIPAMGWSDAPLADLPPGALIATGSARRRAQLAYLRPDLSLLRDPGEHGTPGVPGRRWLGRRRGGGGGGHGAFGLVGTGSATFSDPIDVLPSGRAGSDRRAVPRRRRRRRTALLAAIDDADSHRALRAERSVLAGLGGSCTVPVGAWAESAPGSPSCTCTGWSPRGRAGRDPDVAYRRRSRAGRGRGGACPARRRGWIRARGVRRPDPGG